MSALIPPDMRLGAWVSGIGHGGLFLWLIVGGFFVARDDLADFTVSDVSIVSAEEFAALQPSSPETGETPAALQAPEPETSPPTPVVQQETTPSVPEAVQPLAPAPEQAPEPLPEPETPTIIEEDAPISPEPPQESTAAIVQPDAVPVPRPAPRVAPEAIATPEPDVVIDEVDQAPTAPTDEPVEDVQEAQEQTAQEAAAEEIVTEAETPSDAAPKQSVRPATRPRRPPPPTTEVAEELPSVPGLLDTINGAVAEANAQADNANSGQGSGPPITRGEKEAFILAIRQCWNVGALSSDALRVTVVIGMAMAQNGRPDSGSIRMVSSEGGSGAAVRQAFEAGRRAIIRCGANGYDLPKDKYDQWKEVQVTFNPERMRIK